MKWQSKEELKQLLIELVEFPSVTYSKSEKDIVTRIYDWLHEASYFQEHPDDLNKIPLSDGREALMGLVKAELETEDTVILLSHIDVVDTEGFGMFQNLAFSPNQLTTSLKQHQDALPQEAREDLRSGDWLFGRGTMDMKAGTALHLSMIERALNGTYSGNVLILVVPDEEVNSQGMIESVKFLADFQKRHNLTLQLCINSESTFRQHREDEQNYVYTGSLGKALPGFLCFGKETHVGEPFQGVNANFMLSALNHKLELNTDFIEKVGEEVTPPPVSLMMRDLKEDYSVKTTVSAVAMYNILFMKQTVSNINAKLFSIMEEAKEDIENHILKQYNQYQKVANLEGSSYHVSVNAFTFSQLYDEAIKRHGEQIVDHKLEQIKNDSQLTERELTIQFVQELAKFCQHMAPMMVLFYSPPFYPAVTSNSQKVTNIIDEVQSAISAEGYDSKRKFYFNGISDLSFIGEQLNEEYDISLLAQNMPLQRVHGHYITKSNIAIPTVNIGPYGKDPHQWTERLELGYSFNVLPDILSSAIEKVFHESKSN
ncbi:M20/M25/M40 family metallo-hydrolase [Alkalibacillus sp. S2W]|uniref:M20/M25/M40 family metallo-hydrolase n=1 Tax=Alkalibacillus sp. S2W TaxID=3386553 RepID=UPI00398D0686